MPEPTTQTPAPTPSGSSAEDTSFNWGFLSTSLPGIFSSAGGIGMGLVTNAGKRIEGEYTTKMQALLNDASLTNAQRDIELQKLKTDYEIKISLEKDKARSDYLLWGLLTAGTLLLGGLMWMIFKRKN